MKDWRGKVCWLHPRESGLDRHGCNLVGDVSSLLFQTVGILCAMFPSLFLFRFCITKRFQKQSDVCHVLCEELFMLTGRPHIAKLMLKQTLVW